MRLRARIAVLVSVAVAGICCVGYGIAQAQGTPSTPGGGDTSTGVQRPVNLSIEDMGKQGDAHVARIDTSSTLVRRLLEKARADRDVVKTLCLNDKLNQLDVTLRSAKERRAALEAAANRKDLDLSAHEFTIMGVYRTRSDRLTAEANQCVGSEVGLLGDTRVTTAVDPTIPDDLGLPPPAPGTPITITPPTCASCSN